MELLSQVPLTVTNVLGFGRSVCSKLVSCESPLLGMGQIAKLTALKTNFVKKPLVSTVALQHYIKVHLIMSTYVLLFENSIHLPKIK